MDRITAAAHPIWFVFMPLISVVIPVHGVEDYLDRCLDSVLSDPAAPIEVIAVDDASPDRCGAILAARRDPRLRVLTTEVAGGPGPARDLGLEKAAGEYVWFVDGDDEVAEGALAAVAGALARLRPDVLAIDYENLYPDGTTSPSDGAPYLREGEPGPLAAQPGLIHLPMTAWSKVYRRDFLTTLGQSFGSNGPAPHEDVPVTSLALLTAGRIGVLDRVCYRYRRSRQGSYLAAPDAANFNIFASYQQIFKTIDKRISVPAQEIPPAVYTAVFERAIWHYTTLLPLVPRRRRREFFRRMSDDFRRWRPAGYQFPPGPRGAKFRLVARRAYGAYALLDPVNRLRVRRRGRK